MEGLGMRVLAKTWLKSAAMAVAILGYAGSGAWAELIHQWDFEETLGTGPVDSDANSVTDTFTQNLNLVGLSPAGTPATQVSNAGTGAPLGLGSQSLKSGDGNAATAGGQKASVFSTSGVPGIGFKNTAAATASMWVYRTADQQVG